MASSDDLVRRLENKANQAERYVHEVEARIAAGDERTPASKHMNDMHRAEANACRAIAAGIEHEEDPVECIRGLVTQGPQHNIEAYDQERYKKCWLRTCESILKDVEATPGDSDEAG